ncbi:MAG: hypothetical protein HEQ35_30780 [Gloeotrichia echinulata IR180]
MGRVTAMLCPYHDLQLKVQQLIEQAHKHRIPTFSRSRSVS